MNLTSLGWNNAIEMSFADFAELGLEAARVVRTDRGQLLVACADGVCAAVIAGSPLAASEAPPPATGDWVAVDRSQATPVIRAILPRRSSLTRRRPGAAERAQVVAANVDIVLIVDGLDRGPNSRRIARGVAIAYGGGATPIVVLNKADLSLDRDAAIRTVAGAAPFVEIVAVSATTGMGIGELGARLVPGTSAVLIGPSGVGKSTLGNALLHDERLAVGRVRHGDLKGRHTTTRSELVRLPGGACLIDTPGIRELGLWLDADAVDAAFADIETLARECRFSDCAHHQEPGCAVVAAVEIGALEASRLVGYHKLRREAEIHEARFDPVKARQRKARDRAFGKLCRAALKTKNSR